MHALHSHRHASERAERWHALHPAHSGHPTHSGHSGHPAHSGHWREQWQTAGPGPGPAHANVHAAHAARLHAAVQAVHATAHCAHPAHTAHCLHLRHALARQHADTAAAGVRLLELDGQRKLLRLVLLLLVMAHVLLRLHRTAIHGTATAACTHAERD